MTTTAGGVSTRSPHRLGRGRRLWFALAGVGLVVAGIVVVGPPPGPGVPLDPSSPAPLGTKALVLFLDELGAEVDVGGAVPDSGDDVALVLDDNLNEAERAAVGRWVDAGGTLVVADPASPLHPFSVDSAAFSFVGPSFDDRCSVGALAPVGSVSPPAGSVGYEPIPGAEGCFFRDGSALVALAGQGQGSVVAVGGAGMFTNDAIGDAGNAALAAALLAPRPATAVRFVGPSSPGNGQESLVDLVGDNVRAGLVQAGVAFALYLAWRARRLGSPVREIKPVTLEACELVVAVGQLRHQAGLAAAAAAAVSDDVRRRLGERLGLGGQASKEQVVEVVVARTGLAGERVRSVIAPPPILGSEALLAHVASAETLYQEVVHG